MTKNRLSLKHKLKLAWSNFMERKWRNIIIALATSIGFTGILISFGLGNAIVSMINDSIGGGKLPSQVQIGLNVEIASTSSLNQSDFDYVTEKVGAKNIKYLEQLFSITLSKIDLGQQGNLNLEETMPSYSQVVSLFKNVDIKSEVTDKKAIEAGKVYKNPKEKGLSIPQSLLDDLNKNKDNKVTAQDLLGKEVELTFIQHTVDGPQTVTWKTTITRVFKDEFGSSTAFMSPAELDQIITEKGLTKTIPYFLLELNNPDSIKKVVEKLQKNKRYQVVSQQTILDTVITFIRVIQGLLIVLSTQAIVVSIVMIGVITYINIMQRSREIGVMRAVGYQAKDVKSIFVIEALMISFISLAMAFIGANLIGSIANVIVRHFYESIPTIFKLGIQEVGVMSLLALFMGFVSAYFPTRKISKLDPVEALRYE